MGLEHYMRLRKLGKGSFGEVFLVQDKRDQQQYVMKEVDLVQFGPKGRKEALKEVGFLNAMNHPYIVGYREFFEQDANGLGKKMLYIIMQYADGGDLDGRIKAQNGRLFPEAQIISWFVQCCLAVKHIHDRKILHRDLKCENVFLQKGANGSLECRLGDFGISKSMAHTMAQAMTRIGTPYYLSPEICMNKPYNQKSDMWSLGVVLYELMSLKHPFDATSMEALLNKIVKSQPPALPKVYSIELRTVVDSLLSKQPSKRPTVNSLLKLPFLAPHVQRLLSPAQLQDEFSHTMIHSDASARNGGAHAHGGAAREINQPPAMPVANQVAAQQREQQMHHHHQQQHQQQQQPPKTGIRPQQPQQRVAPPPATNRPPVHPASHHPSGHPSSAAAAAAAAAVESAAPGRASPFYGGPSAQPVASYRPASGQQQQQQQQHQVAHLYPSAGSPVPATPAPYAGMSNADKIRAIRQAKEAELREIKAQQAEVQARKQAAQQQQQQQQQKQQQHLLHQPNGYSSEDPERERQRLREQQKERQMAQQQQQQQQQLEYHLPPALRGAVGVGRGIPAVSRRDDGGQQQQQVYPGIPYHSGGGPQGQPPQQQAKLQQHQAMAQQAQRQREEEVTRMRVNYFKERKQKRETNLAHFSGGGGGGGAAAAAAAVYGGGGQQRPVGGMNAYQARQAYISRPQSAQPQYQQARPGVAGAPLQRKPGPLLPQPIAYGQVQRHASEPPRWR